MVINKTQQMQFQSFDNMPERFSDIDGFRIVRDKYAIFLEAKHERNTDFSKQIYIFKSLCDHLGIPSIYIVYSHNMHQDSDIDVAECPVLEYYFNGVWYKTPFNVKQLTENFIRKYE